MHVFVDVYCVTSDPSQCCWEIADLLSAIFMYWVTFEPNHYWMGKQEIRDKLDFHVNSGCVF